jgi:tetrahydromethanopterin S-methyltransferase subunit E
MVRGGGFAGGPVVVNNTLQWKLFRERVYNIFIYTQLFRVKNFSSICLYCIIVSVDIYTSHPPPPLPHPIFIFLIYCIHVGVGGVGGGGWMWLIKTILLIYFA